MSNIATDSLVTEQEEKEESMEELKMMEDDEHLDHDDEDMVKEKANAEDFMGMEPLLMSDSENESPRKNVHKQGEDVAEGNLKQTKPDQEESETAQSKAKKRMIIDSDDEDNEVQTRTDETSVVVLKDKELSKLERQVKKKYGNLSDSESDTEPRKCIVSNETDAKLDEESDKKEYDDGLTDVQRKLKAKYANLIDSDTEQEASDNDEENNRDKREQQTNSSIENEKEIEKPKKQKNPKRASTKKALDEIQAIQSEQQRLHREAYINVPYHVPKQRTLKEFLNRRTISKPNLQDEDNPAATALKPQSLRMTSEELAEYAKLMEERVKEAIEFFKSESESESEEDNDELQNSETIKESASVIEEKLKSSDAESENLNKMPELDIDKSIDTDLPILEDVSILTTQPVITEVLELPKLDLSTIHITPERLANKSQSQLKKSENIKRLLSEQKLSISPSLKGDPNMLIDLESGDLVQKTPSGVDNLLQRLMSTKARRRKAPESVSILSVDNGKVELSKVHIHPADEKESNMEHKPGAAFFKLKNNLKSIIKQKRLEEIKRKQEDEKEHLKCLEDDDDEEEELDEFEPDLNPESIDATDDMDEVETVCNIDNDEYEDIDEENDFVPSKETDVSIDTENVSMDEESDSDSDNDAGELDQNADITTQRKNRIITAFQDDSDEDVDLLKTQHVNVLQPLPLFNIESQQSKSQDEQELLALCSGKFDETQKPQNESVISQIPITQHKSIQEHTEELLDLCSGTFETQKVQNHNSLPADMPTSNTITIASKSNKILSSDEENESKEATTSQRTKKLTKRMKKRTVKLGFSDDEDEHNSDESDLEIADGAEDVVIEEPETYVDYDSEENEILVQMTKKDCAKEANKFLEKEAELSESDWGSADEDEKNMDKYDIELGDEEQFDREKLQHELGQIHARKMLDDDIREVRKFQEMFIADEDEDGMQRQRQFKWKNAESGFSLDDDKREIDADTNGHESADDENEQLWRKIRFEREQVLLEQNQKVDQSSNVSSLSTCQSNTTIMGTNKKLNIITSRKTLTTMHVKNSTPFLITRKLSPATTNSPIDKKVRGSFLVRDRATLDKLASMTKGTAAPLSAVGGMAPRDDSTAGTVSVKAVKAKNFVFATLTEEEHENLKRKADDLINSSSEKGINYMKKPKIEPRRAKCLIDQLL